MARQISTAPVVGVERAWKTFRIPHERSHTLKERALHPFRRRGVEEFAALRDVSFDVRRGEFFGIVGRNGSGKSTLLKCLAGVYGLDRGRIVIDGRVSTFIELGVGFNPDLAARDNVVMNGIMLGLTAKEARARFNRIIEFAELEEYTDLKLKNYSSGMYVRLAFSVAIQVEADILLIDEVLAVGDASFQQKCFDVFNDMRRRGRTVLFVTHDMGAVTRMCDRAALLDNGRLVAIGHPQEVAGRYLDLNFNQEQARETGSEPDEDESGGETPATKARSAKVTDGWLEGDDGALAGSCMQHRSYTFKFAVEFLEDIEDPAFTVLFQNEQYEDMLVATTAFRTEEPRRFDPQTPARLSVTFENVFRPGRYYCSVIVAHRTGGKDVLDRHDGVLDFVSVGPYATGGLTDIRHEMVVVPERAKRTASPEPA